MLLLRALVSGVVHQHPSSNWWIGAAAQSALPRHLVAAAPRLQQHAALAALAQEQAALPLLGRCVSTSAAACTNSNLGASAAPHHSSSTAADSGPVQQQQQQDYMEHPTGRLPYTQTLEFKGGPSQPLHPWPSFRTISSTGKEMTGINIPHPLTQASATRIYEVMARLQTMDTLCYDAQRQGRFSFYLTSQGEEATVVGSAAALEPNDMVFAQYREQGVLMWRGFTFRQFADQLMGNQLESGKGRQMPIHYGSKELCYQTISSPLATQLPHAAGAAYAMKLSGARTVSVVYFGEGASSEGDAHAGLNFAATLEVPCVFICRNNGYAISTPATEQYRGDGIAPRGPMYGMSAVRVDGGDAQAVYNAIKEARRMAVEGSQPVLVECMSYRAGHHSTSDDSTRYRTSDEMRAWRSRDPVSRFRLWLISKGWWSEVQEQALRLAARKELIEALEAAAQVPKPPLKDLFTDVYKEMPWNIKEQMDETLEFAKRHPELVPPGAPVS